MPDISGHEPILNVKHVSESIHTDPPGFVVLNQLEQLPLPTSNSDVKSYTEYFLESFFRTLLFWETDTKRLGTIIRILHHSFIYVFAVCFIIIHTIMPSFIGLLILFLVYTVMPGLSVSEWRLQFIWRAEN